MSFFWFVHFQHFALLGLLQVQPLGRFSNSAFYKTNKRIKNNDQTPWKKSCAISKINLSNFFYSFRNTPTNSLIFLSFPFTWEWVRFSDSLPGTRLQSVTTIWDFKKMWQMWKQPKCPSTHGWIKKMCIYTWNIVQHKKELNSDTRYNMDESWKHCAKWSKPDTKRQILYESTYKRYLG